MNFNRNKKKCKDSGNNTRQNNNQQKFDLVIKQ